MPILKEIAIIDPSSYSLPYDYFYINEVNKEIHVDFYFSKTSSNYEYIEKLKLCKNVTLHEYCISPSSNNRVNGLINYLAMLKDIFLSRKKYSHIHFIWSIFFILEFFLFFVIKEKFIFTFHNDVPHSYHKKVYCPYKVIARLASKIVFVSQYTMNAFIKNYAPNTDCHLIQHGLMPIDTLANVKKDKNIQTERKLLFWGRVEEYKGVDLFDGFTVNYPVEIYGRWSLQLAELKAKLALKNNIFINDNYLELDELAIMLSRDVIFILPYKDATQSGVLYTLLAYGKVFISSDVGENKDFLIKHGLSKLVFNRNDPESIKRAIEYAFNEYSKIQLQFLEIKNEYKWENIMNDKTIDTLYGL